MLMYFEEYDNLIKMRPGSEEGMLQTNKKG